MEGLVEKSSVIEFGQKYVESIKLTSINEVDQIRKTYPQEQIEELANAIDMSTEDSDSPEFNLLNPLLVARLSPESTDRYLNNHSEFFKTPVRSIKDLTQSEDGHYYILISGHRRKRSIELLSEKHEIPKDDVTIASSIYEDISFEDALVLQVRENTHEKVSPHEEASYIAQYYDYLCHNKPSHKPTIKQIAAKLGRSEHVVSNALAFKSLPEEIQNYASIPDTLVPYSTLVQFRPLMLAYAEYHTAKSIAEDKNEYIKNQLHTMAAHLWNVRLENRGKTDADSIIRAKIKTLRTESSFEQDTFFLEGYSDIPSIKIRQDTSKKLTRTAITAIELAMQASPQLTERDLERLDSLVQKAKEAARSLEEATAAMF